MSPRESLGSEQRTQTPATVAELADRVAAVERQQRQLKCTLEAVARQLGVGIAAPCTHCRRSHLLVVNSNLSCPACGYRESL